MTHTKQLSLVTFYDTTAGIGASFQTLTHGWNHGWRDRCGGWNSSLDVHGIRGDKPREGDFHNPYLLLSKFWDSKHTFRKS